MGAILDWLLGFIHSYIEDFVEPINGTQLQLGGLLLGKLSIENVQLKQKALDMLPMPMTLHFQFVGSIKLSLPIWSLFTAPIHVEVSDVIMVLGSKKLKDWEMQHFEDNFIPNKKASLAGHEAGAFVQSMEDGFLWRTIIKLASNVKVDVNNVQIRFEDWYAGECGPYAIGVNLDNCHVGNVHYEVVATAADTYNKVGKGAYSDANVIRKQVDVAGVAVYCDPLLFDSRASPPAHAKLGNFANANKKCVAVRPSHRARGMAFGRPKSQKLNRSSSAVQENDAVPEEEGEGEGLSALAGAKDLIKSVWGWVRGQRQQDEETETAEATLPNANNLDARPNTSNPNNGRGHGPPLHKLLHVVEHYNLDGQWPYRDLLSEFCEVRVYIPNETGGGHWQSLDDVLGQITSASAQLGHDDDLMRNGARLGMYLESHQERLQEDLKLSRLDKGRLPPEIDPNKRSKPSALKKDSSLPPSPFRGPRLRPHDRAAEPSEPLPIPALRVDPKKTEQFKLKLREMQSAYHQYIINPQRLTTVLSLCLLPVEMRGLSNASLRERTTEATRNFLVRSMNFGAPPSARSPSRREVTEGQVAQTWRQRLYSLVPPAWRRADTEGKDMQNINKRLELDMEPTIEEEEDGPNNLHLLPMCRVDVDVSNIRVTISAEQIKYLMAWVEIYGNLYGTWTAAIQAKLEKARPSFPAAQLYLDAWLIKMCLIKGAQLPDGLSVTDDKPAWPVAGLTESQKRIILWCHNFELAHNSGAIVALRKEALDRWRHHMMDQKAKANSAGAGLLDWCKHGTDISSSSARIPESKGGSQISGVAIKPIAGVNGDSEINTLYSMALSELHSSIIEESQKSIRKIVFTTDIYVNAFVSDAQVYIDMGQEDVTFDLGILLEGAAVQVVMKTDKPSGFMSLSCDLYAMTLLTLSNFARPFGPLPIESLNTNSAERQEEMKRAREKLLQFFSHGRMLPEQELLKFTNTNMAHRLGLGGGRSRPGKFRKFADGARGKNESTTSATTDILMMIHRSQSQVEELDVPTPRGMEGNRMTQQREIMSHHDRVFQFITGKHGLALSPLMQQLQERVTPALNVKMAMHLYRLPDCPDMDVSAKIMEQISVIVSVPAIMMLLQSSIPLIEVFALKNLWDLNEICSKADVLASRAHSQLCNVGDLPHTSMKLRAEVCKPIKVAIPCESHPICEGLILQVGPLLFDTPHLSPRKPVIEAVRLPLKDQQDVFSVDVSAIFIHRSHCCLSSLLRSDTRTFLGVDAAADWIQLTRHYNRMITKFDSFNKSPPKITLGSESQIEVDVDAGHAHQQHHSRYSYLLYPLGIQECVMRMTHLPARYSAPSLHVDLFLSRIALEVNTFDLVLLAKVGAKAGAMYGVFGAQMAMALQRMANAAAQAEYIIQTVRPDPKNAAKTLITPSPSRDRDDSSRRTSRNRPAQIIITPAPTDAKDPTSVKASTVYASPLSEPTTPFTDVRSGQDGSALIDTFLDEADLDEILGARFVASHFMSTGEVPSKVPTAAKAKPEIESDIERWGRMSKHVEFYKAPQASGEGGEFDSAFSPQSEQAVDLITGLDLLPKSPQLWLPREQSFMLVHFKVGQVSLLVCAVDMTDLAGDSGEMLGFSPAHGHSDSFSDDSESNSSKRRHAVWDPKITFPPKHHAYNEEQTTEPLLSIHLSHITAICGIGSAGDMAASACIGNMRMNEELGITPLNMSNLYFTSPDMIQPCLPVTSYVRNWCGIIQDENLRTILSVASHADIDMEMPLIKDPLRELVYYSDWYARQCHSGSEFLSEQENHPQHIRVNYVGNTSNFQKLFATIDMTPFRLTLPLEFVDELTDFLNQMTLTMTDGSTAPVQTNDGTATVATDLNAINAAATANITLPPFQPVRFRSLSDSATRYPLLPLPPINPVCNSEDRLIETGHVQMRLSAFEILIPSEPVRLPEKGARKKTTFTFDNTDESSELRSSEHTLEYPVLNSSCQDQVLNDDRFLSKFNRALAIKTIDKWRSIVHETIKTPVRGMRASLAIKNRTTKLPMCLVIRFGLNADLTLYQYQSTIRYPCELRPLFEGHNSLLQRSLEDVDSSTGFIGEAHDANVMSSKRLSRVEDPLDRDSSRRVFRFRKTLKSYRWVDACLRAPTSAQPLIRHFCPGQIHVNVTAESITVDFLRPSCWNAFSIPRLFWQRHTILSNDYNAHIEKNRTADGYLSSEDTCISPLVSPMTCNIIGRIALPGEREMYERFYGFSRLESTTARKLFGIPSKSPPEFVEFEVLMSPIGISTNESSTCQLLKFLTLVSSFGAHVGEKGTRYSLMAELLARYDMTAANTQAEEAEEREMNENNAGNRDRNREGADPISGEVVPPDNNNPPADQATTANVAPPEPSSEDEDDDCASYTDWLLGAGMPPELAPGLFGYNISTSWDRVVIKMQIPLIRFTIWDCQLSSTAQRQGRPVLLDLTVSEFSFNAQCDPVNSFSQPQEWWGEINSGEQLLAGTDLIALSFVSYDFEPLLENPYRIRPTPKKGLYYVLKAVAANYYASYRLTNTQLDPANQQQEEMDLTFRGRLGEVRSKIAAALPWFHFSGQMCLGADCSGGSVSMASPSGSGGAGSRNVSEKEISIIEPFLISFVGGKRNPKSNLHVTTEISWINMTVSLMLLDCWLKFALEIICHEVPEEILKLKLVSYLRVLNKRMIKYGAATRAPSTMQSHKSSRPGDYFSRAQNDHCLSTGTAKYPSFVRYRGAINSIRRWVLGRLRPILPAMTEEMWSGTRFMLRPIGAWDPNKALAENLTAISQALGAAFYANGRAFTSGQFTANSDFPVIPDAVKQLDDAAAETAVGVAAILTGGTSFAAPSAPKTQVLNAVNLLGQPIAIYLKSGPLESPSGSLVGRASKHINLASGSGQWLIIPPEGSIPIPVYIEGQELVVSDFCVRFRLLSDIFELRSTVELYAFSEVVQNHVSQELLSQKQGNTSILRKPHSRIHYYTVTINESHSSGRSSPSPPTAVDSGTALLGSGSNRLKVREKQSTKPGVCVGRAKRVDGAKLMKQSITDIDSRSKVPILVRLTANSADARIPVNKSSRYLEVQSNFKLIFSSAFTVKNMTQESLCLLNMCPTAYHNEPEMLRDALLSESQKKTDDIIQENVPSTLNAWLQSREMMILMYRLPPPPPPTDDGEPDWSAHSAEATTAARKIKSLMNTDVFDGFDLSSLGGEYPADASLGRQTSSRWQKAVQSLRQLALHASLVDGVSCLILPPNAPSESSDLRVGGDSLAEPAAVTSGVRWPSRCPRVIPLHWLLARQGYVAAMDLKSCRAAKHETVQKYLSKPSQKGTPDTARHHRPSDILLYANRQFLISMTTQRDKINTLLSAREINRMLLHYEIMAGKTEITALTHYVHKVDPKPKILKLELAKKIQVDSADPSPAVDSALGSPGSALNTASQAATRMFDIPEMKFYALSQAVVSVDPFLMAGDGICLQTVIAPLFEISNRLPRPLHVASARMTRRLARLNMAAAAAASVNADNLAGSVPEIPSIGLSIPAGENQLVPLGDTGLEFTFGSVKSLGSISINIHAHEQENLELICRRIQEGPAAERRTKRNSKLADLKDTFVFAGGSTNVDRTDVLSKSEVVLEDGIPPDEDFYVSLEVSPTNVQTVGCSAALTGGSNMTGDNESVVISCRSFMKTLTLYSDLWIVNRMNYPLSIKAKPNIDLLPHKRVVATAILSRNGTGRLAIDKRTFGSIPGSKYFIRQDKGDVFMNNLKAEQTIGGLASLAGGGGLTGGLVSSGHHQIILSNPIKLSSSSLSVALPTYFPATETTPALSHVLWIARSPSPFIRTSTAEIMPAYVIANDSNINTLYVRESPYSQDWLQDKSISHGAFITVPPGGRVEFHPQQRKRVRIQVSGLQEVETFHHVVLQQSNAQKNQYLDADAPLWSQPVLIDNAQCFQVRYPTVEPATPLSIGAFELVDISVTKKNGVRLISLIPNHLPEYRLCNLTKLPIGIAQHNLDGPFEILKPHRGQQSEDASSSKTAAFEKAIGTWEISRLTNLSIPFNLYDRNLPSTVEFWICSRNMLRNQRKAGKAHDDAHEKHGGKANVSDALSDEYGGNSSTTAASNNAHGAAKVVLRQRRQIGNYMMAGYYDAGMNETMLMRLMGGAKGNEEITSQLEYAFNQMNDVTDKELKFWNAQKRTLCRIFDLNKHFDQMKRRKIHGGALTDRMIFLPLTPRGDTIFPVRIKLRFLSGVKWLIFEDFKGIMPQFKQIMGSSSMRPPPSPGLLGEPPGQQPAKTDMALIRKVNELWIKMQENPGTIGTELATLCKYSDVQSDEMRRIFPFGNAAAKSAFDSAYTQVVGSPFKHDLSTPEHQDSDALDGPPPFSGAPFGGQPPFGEHIGRTAIKTTDKITTGDDAYEIEAENNSKQVVERDDEDIAAADADLIVNPLDSDVPEISNNFSADVRIDGFGLDIVDHRLSRDLLYISLARMALSCHSSSYNETFKILLSVGWCQIDANSGDSYYPTVVRPIRDVHHNANRAVANAEEVANGISNETHPNVILPGESSHGSFNFDDPRLFDPLLLERFGGSQNFDFLRVVLENRVAQAALEVETLSQRFVEYIRLKDRAEKLAEMTHQQPNVSPTAKAQANDLVRHPDEDSSSIFVSQLGAVALPQNFSTATSVSTEASGALLDIPLCAIDLCPIAINVDYPLIQALMKLMDHALVIFQRYSLDLIQGDPTEIQQSERQPYTDSWKKYLGGTDCLFRTKAVLFKISLSSLDIGEIRLILNINLGSRSLRKRGKAQTKSQGNFIHTGTATMNPKSDDWEDEPNAAPTLMLKKSNDSIRGQINNFVIANQDPALSPYGDLAPGIRNDDDEPIRSEYVKAILGFLQLKASLSDAQIQLPSMQYRDITGASDEVAGEIITPYITKAAKQVAKVLGAIDLLGNPSMVVRHLTGGMRRAVTEIKFGCFRSTTSYGRLHPSVEIRSRIWQQPCLVAFFAVRHCIVGLSSALLEGVSRCLGSWTQLLETVARNGDSYSLQPGATSGVNSGSIVDQPATVFEGVRMGCNTGMYLAALSIGNLFVKPVRGCIAAAGKKAEAENMLDDCEAGSDDSHEEISCGRRTCVALGTVGCASLSALGSCICGPPTALCACCSFTAGGALQNIIKIPMLSGVRSRRTFFRPAGNNTFASMRQYESHYALWSSLGNGTARVSRFLGISRSNQLLKMYTNVVLTVPLALYDIKNGGSMPGVLLLGTQKMGLMTKRGVHWHLPWRRLESVDYLVINPAFHNQNSIQSANFITAIRFSMNSKQASEECYTILNAEPMVGWDQFMLISNLLIDLATPS